VTPEEVQEMINACLLPDFDDDEDMVFDLGGVPIVLQSYDLTR